MPKLAEKARNTLGAVFAALGLFARNVVAALGYLTTPEDFEAKVTPWLEWQVLGMPMIDLVGWTLIATAGLMIFWPWLGRKLASSPAEPSSSSAPATASEVYNVASHGQSGGITAGKLINQAPRPRLRIRQEEPAANSDGTYTTTAVVEVDSPYPPAALYLEVCSTTILDFQCIPDRMGLMIGGHSGTRPDSAFTTIQNPSGRYTLTVKSSEPTKPRIGYAFS